MQSYSREGYDPDWLALEDAAGGRSWFGNDLDKDIALFNQNSEMLAKLWPVPDEPLNIFDESFQSSEHEMQYRVYQPTSSTPLPVLVFFHGGGFVAGNLDTEDAQCKTYAAKTPCVLVSVRYPLAPKTKLDGIISAGVEAVSYVSKNAGRFNGDASKLIVIGGSAGAVLSATISYHFTSVLKDYSTIYGCVLISPMLGNWNYKGKHHEQYRAWEEMADTDQPIFNRKHWETVAALWDIDNHSPRHYILFDPDLSHFPPTYVVTAEKEVARDESLLLKLRLDDEGVRCRYKVYPGLPHWFHIFPQIKMSHVFLDDTLKGIEWLLSGSPA